MLLGLVVGVRHLGDVRRAPGTYSRTAAGLVDGRCYGTAGTVPRMKHETPRDVDGAKLCAWCGETIRQSGVGRSRDYCRRSCRQRAYEARKNREAVVAAVAAAVARSRPDSTRDERPEPDDSTRDETQPQVNPPIPPPAVPASTRPAVPPARQTMPTPDMSKPKRERGSLFPPFRGKPRQSSLFDDQEPDEQPETDAR